MLLETSTQSRQYEIRTTVLRTTDYGLPTTDYGLRTTDYGLRTEEYNEDAVRSPWLNPVPQDSSEYSVQLYPSNSISDFRLVEKHERALINTPAVWYGVALRESHKTFQAQTSTCIGMRQSVSFYSTRSGNSKLSSFLGIGQFARSLRRLLHFFNL